jgi:hypothetical protein
MSDPGDRPAILHLLYFPLLPIKVSPVQLLKKPINGNPFHANKTTNKPVQDYERIPRNLLSFGVLVSLPGRASCHTGRRKTRRVGRDYLIKDYRKFLFFPASTVSSIKAAYKSSSLFIVHLNCKMQPPPPAFPPLLLTPTEGQGIYRHVASDMKQFIPLPVPPAPCINQGESKRRIGHVVLTVVSFL